MASVIGLLPVDTDSMNQRVTNCCNTEYKRESEPSSYRIMARQRRRVGRALGLPVAACAVSGISRCDRSGNVAYSAVVYSSPGGCRWLAVPDPGTWEACVPE